ncbi:hypothetical protein [Haloarchaeobius iranensis]|uniref:hypothetical protein n=1 Tax=Haloarchaeobius iranensis TaxID=996166 RepID=UPI001114397D|nr:hypothetical protein [Haloarchaeobius iranensis]
MPRNTVRWMERGRGGRADDVTRPDGPFVAGTTEQALDRRRPESAFGRPARESPGPDETPMIA